MILAARSFEKCEMLAQELNNALPLQMNVADKSSTQPKKAVRLEIDRL